MAWEMGRARTLVPTLNDRPYHEAMPLAAWSALAVARLEGEVTPLSARLASGLATVGLVAATILVGARLASARVGIAAGAIVLASPIVAIASHQSRIDPVLALGVAVAIAASSEGARRGWRHDVVAGLALAVAVAAKGPLAAGYVACAVVPSLALEREARGLSLVAGGAIVLAVAAAATALWLDPYFRYLGPDETRAFLDQFLLRENLEKLETGYGKAAPWWSYLVDVPRAFAPWVVPAVLALARVAARPRETTRLERLAASWAVLAVVLLSFASGKHIRYLLSLTPGWALLAAIELDRWLASPRANMSRCCAVLAAVSLVAGVAAPCVLLARGELGARALFTALVVVGASGAALAALRARRVERALVALCATYAGAIAFVFGAVFALPEVERTFPYAELAHIVADRVPPSEPLTIADDRAPFDKDTVSEQQLGLYLARPVERRSPASRPTGFVLAPEATAPRGVIVCEIEWHAGARWRLVRAE
jgi:4-amino-4-deoxy-L-arabinose transferase-like glycosyltransferase